MKEAEERHAERVKLADMVRAAKEETRQARHELSIEREVARGAKRPSK